MNTTLLVIGLCVAILMLLALLRAARDRSGARMTDQQYFAAARQRAIEFRLAARAAKAAE